MQRLFIAEMVVLCSSSLVHGGEPKSAEASALDFSYQGVSVGTTLEDFTSQHPAARRTEFDASCETSTYLFRGQDGRIAEAFFFQGRVYQLVLILTQDTLRKMGGKAILERKLLATFGSPHVVLDRGSRWQFPDVQRTVVYTGDIGSGVGLGVFDTVMIEEVNEVKAKNLDLGF